MPITNINPKYYFHSLSSLLYVIIKHIFILEKSSNDLQITQFSKFNLTKLNLTQSLHFLPINLHQDIFLQSYFYTLPTLSYQLHMITVLHVFKDFEI